MRSPCATAPLTRHTIGRFFRRQLLSRPMPAGIRLPAAMDAQFNTGRSRSLDTAIAAYARAIDRLSKTTDFPHHPLFGTMTRAEVEQWHCRHAELHLSFLHPKVA